MLRKVSTDAYFKYVSLIMRDFAVSIFPALLCILFTPSGASG